jgi:hypothetical protein
MSLYSAEIWYTPWKPPVHHNFWSIPTSTEKPVGNISMKLLCFMIIEILETSYDLGFLFMKNVTHFVGNHSSCSSNTLGCV